MITDRKPITPGEPPNISGRDNLIPGEPPNISNRPRLNSSDMPPVVAAPRKPAAEKPGPDNDLVFVWNSLTAMHRRLQALEGDALVLRDLIRNAQSGYFVQPAYIEKGYNGQFWVHQDAESEYFVMEAGYVVASGQAPVAVPKATLTLAEMGDAHVLYLPLTMNSASGEIAVGDPVWDQWADLRLQPDETTCNWPICEGVTKGGVVVPQQLQCGHITIPTRYVINWRFDGDVFTLNGDYHYIFAWHSDGFGFYDD